MRALHAIRMFKQATPADPAAADIALYAKADGLLYKKNGSTESVLYSADNPVAPTITQVEVDFGATPHNTEAFTITDAAVSSSSHIMAAQAGNAPTGRQADENEMEPLVCSAVPGTGSFTLYVSSVSGTPLTGHYKINYMVG